MSKPKSPTEQVWHTLRLPKRPLTSEEIRLVERFAQRRPAEPVPLEVQNLTVPFQIILRKKRCSTHPCGCCGGSIKSGDLYLPAKKGVALGISQYTGRGTGKVCAPCVQTQVLEKGGVNAISQSAELTGAN